jgi:surfeit locus 1 family protein
MIARTNPVRGLVLPAILSLIGIAVLLGFGFWQLDRLAWKEDLIARVEARTTAPPVPLPGESEWSRINYDDDEYRRVTLTGSFRHDRETLVYTVLSDRPRGFSGPGFFVLTPLELASGASVIVNRGFVPLDRKNPATRRAGQVEGTVTLTGLLRMPEQANFVSPGNDPARDAWYRRDPGEIARARGIERAAPFTVDADNTPNPGGLPQGGETRVTFANNHLQYVVTWFGLAFALAAVFAAFAWQRIRRPAS